jgi:ATP-dependent DNA helicase MPH1
MAEQRDAVADNTAAGKRKASNSIKLASDPIFKGILTDLECYKAAGGFPYHPKMDRMKGIIMQHFGERMDEDDAGKATKVMIFVTHREVVDEIVECLNAQRPLIRASKFVGQSADKKGNKGLAQKEQLDVRLFS